jgi:hypothetical protein
VTIAGVLGALIVLVALLEPTDFMRGLLLGAGLATIGWELCYVVLMNDGSYTWRRGADAEELTAELLEKELPGWSAFHGICLVSGDIDHVLVGSGGVIAVETKWTAQEFEGRHGKHQRYRAALQQAQLSARRVRSLLQSKGIDAEVAPMLVVWGRGAPHFKDGTREVDGVLVVEGRSVPTLADRLAATSDGTDAGSIVDVLSELR